MRRVLLGGIAAFIFVMVAALLVAVMPGPLKESNYLVIGSVATLVSMLAIFLVLVSTTMKSSDVFFKRRPK